MTHQRFITKKGKKIPIGSSTTSGLTSKKLGITVKTPSRATVMQIKQKNAPDGHFSGMNVVLKKMERVKLESVGRLKNGASILKGTSPSNGITVVRIVSSKP